jgi:hypothetical protein
MLLQSVFTKTANIASGQSLSGIVALNGEFAVVGIIMPAAWTAAPLTWQISMDPIDATPTNFFDVYDDLGAELSVTVAANRAVMLSNTIYIAGRFFRVRSGPSATPVTQAADRAISLIYRAI